MSRKGDTLRGKVAGSHSTYVELAGRLIRVIKKIPCVRRISLGVIKPCPNGLLLIKAVRIPAGLRFKVRDVNAVQTVYVYTDCEEEVLTLAQDALKMKINYDRRERPL